MLEICIARKSHTFCILIFMLLQSEGPTCIALVLLAEYQCCEDTLVQTRSGTHYQYYHCFVWFPNVKQICFKFLKFLKINCTFQNANIHMLNANWELRGSQSPVCRSKKKVYLTASFCIVPKVLFENRWHHYARRILKQEA